MQRPRLAPVLRGVAATAAALIVATLAVWAAEAWLRVPNASAIYVVAVAVTAVVAGWPGAVAASVGAFLLYDFFFTEPRFTFTIHDPGEWLTLVLLVFVGVLVGRLTVLQHRQTQTARSREREARALFGISRELATRSTTVDALPRIAQELTRDTVATRVWVEVADLTGRSRIVVDTDGQSPRPAPKSHFVLRRMPGDTPAEWFAIHTGRGGSGAAAGWPTAPAPGAAGGPAKAGAGTVAHADTVGPVLYRVGMEASGHPVGVLWVLVPREAGRPGRTDTRLMAAVADQVGQALEHDRLARDAQEAEIARRSDQLKTALLESVSHDLRTPLASIRAAAGSLMDRSLPLGPEDRFADAEMIDREAEHLNRIVTNLLDMSRVEAGGLRVDLDACDLADLVETALERVRRRLGDRSIELALDEAPPVEVDPALFDQVVSNLLENAAKYAAPAAHVRISASRDPAPGTVTLTVEDSGPGVPTASLSQLFDKFYRVPGRSTGSRRGTGVGLAVVRGLTEAMGGRVVARASGLGGLAIDVTLPEASGPRPGSPVIIAPPAENQPPSAAGPPAADELAAEHPRASTESRG